jgi:hypothetical protein
MMEKDGKGLRYVTPVGPEAETQPGSHGQVLRKLRGSGILPP